MATRTVTRSRKDPDDGDITALCNPNERWWSPRSKRDAISDIENGTHEYYADAPGVPRVKIHVVVIGGRKHLRTDPDPHKQNNLDNLPDC
ncbi:MAG: DUF3892 domain-containing protein [Wenzhouxiangellaceae bacterium]